MKKNIFILLFSIITLSGYSQESKFDFNTKYYDALNQWVVLAEKEEKSTYMYGFIYFDEMAGFSLRYSGDFKATDTGGLDDITSEDLKKEMIIMRISSNFKNVALFNVAQLKDLNLPEEPEWLALYKENENEIEYLKQLGYHFNHNGASKQALEPLLKAYKIDPHYDGVEFELAFAHNALGEYNRAIEVLLTAIESDSKNGLLYKELGYAYMYNKNFEKAKTTYLKGLKNIDDEMIKGEMCNNIAFLFHQEKNKEKFDEWAEKTLEYAEKYPMYKRNIEYLKNNWGLRML